MGCSFFEDKGGMFSFSPYCHKKGDYVNSDVFDQYCKGYYYSDCPIYKGNSSSGGCYLTSACVYAKNLPDDCYELQILRTFRDTWMKGSEEGQKSIEIYYETAPKIVLAINDTVNPKAIYEKIYNEMVLPCVRLIEQNKMQETFELYKEKVFELRKLYCKNCV